MQEYYQKKQDKIIIWLYQKIKDISIDNFITFEYRCNNRYELFHLITIDDNFKNDEVFFNTLKLDFGKEFPNHILEIAKKTDNVIGYTESVFILINAMRFPALVFSRIKNMIPDNNIWKEKMDWYIANATYAAPELWPLNYQGFSNFLENLIPQKIFMNKKEQWMCDVINEFSMTTEHTM